MSAENGKLVALRAALFHSVPAHVHELRRQASKLKDENNELMSLAYSQTKKAEGEQLEEPTRLCYQAHRRCQESGGNLFNVLDVVDG